MAKLLEEITQTVTSGSRGGNGHSPPVEAEVALALEVALEMEVEVQVEVEVEVSLQISSIFACTPTRQPDVYLWWLCD